MHNNTGCAVPLTWILLDNQLTVDLIANVEMLVNIRAVRGKDAIRVHYNIGVKIVDRVGNIPGYVTVWYKPTEIANILSVSRATRIFRVVFDSEGGNFYWMVLPDKEVRFQLIHNGLYCFDSTDIEIIFLLLNTVSENHKGFTWRYY